MLKTEDIGKSGYYFIRIDSNDRKGKMKDKILDETTTCVPATNIETCFKCAIRHMPYFIVGEYIAKNIELVSIYSIVISTYMELEID